MAVRNIMHYHVNNVKTDTKTNTALSEHLMENKHTANWDKIEILHTEKLIFKRNLKGGIYIYKTI